MSESLDIKNKTYIKLEELRDIAERIMEEENMDISPARVEYIAVYPYISKTKAGRCIRCNNEMRFLAGCEYIIEVSGDLWDQLDDQTRDILMYHELMHILVVMNDKTGNWEFKLRDHDVQDFRVIIEKYGLDWIDGFRTIVASVHDLDPDEESNIGM